MLSPFKRHSIVFMTMVGLAVNGETANAEERFAIVKPDTRIDVKPGDIIEVEAAAPPSILAGGVVLDASPTTFEWLSPYIVRQAPIRFRLKVKADYPGVRLLQLFTPKGEWIYGENAAEIYVSNPEAYQKGVLTANPSSIELVQDEFEYITISSALALNQDPELQVKVFDETIASYHYPDVICGKTKGSTTITVKYRTEEILVPVTVTSETAEAGARCSDFPELFSGERPGNTTGNPTVSANPIVRTKAVAPPPQELLPRKGELVWKGSVRKGQVIAITGKKCDYGSVTGSSLPGVPVKVRVVASRFDIVEAPNAENGWQMLRLRAVGSASNLSTLISWERLE